MRATNHDNMVRVSTVDPPTHPAKSLFSFLFAVYFNIHKLNDKWSKTAQTWRKKKNTCIHKHTFNVGLILPCLRSVYIFIFCISGRMQKWCPISERKDSKLLKIMQNRACLTCFICTSDAVHCVNVHITLYSWVTADDRFI